MRPQSIASQRGGPCFKTSHRNTGDVQVLMGTTEIFRLEVHSSHRLLGEDASALGVLAHRRRDLGCPEIVSQNLLGRLVPRRCAVVLVATKCRVSCPVEEESTVEPWFGANASH